MLDPREELVHRLLEHEKFKNAAQLLYQKQQIEEHVWSKPDRSLYESEGTEAELVVSLVDLVKVFQQVLERSKEVPQIELHHDTFTSAQMMELLRKQLHTSDEPVSTGGIFRVVPVAACDDCGVSGGAGDGAAASGGAGAVGTVCGYSAAEAQDVRRDFHGTERPFSN